MSDPPWSNPVRLSEVGRNSGGRTLVADEAARRRIAEYLELEDLPELSASVELEPWMDGARLRADWRARVVQICGITLEPFETALGGRFEVHAVPAGSPHGPSEEGGELTLDLDAPDPPDVLADERIDPAAYVVEHLGLEIDPFPRKPDAVYEPPEAEPEASPFALLTQLKPRG